MQNSTDQSNPPSLKYHNIWAFIAALILTIIPLSLQYYSDTKGLDAKQQARIQQADVLIEQLKVKLQEVDLKTNQCNTNVQTLKSTVEQGIVAGAATKVTPTPAIIYVYPRATVTPIH